MQTQPIFDDKAYAFLCDQVEDQVRAYAEMHLIIGHHLREKFKAAPRGSEHPLRDKSQHARQALREHHDQCLYQALAQHHQERELRSRPRASGSGPAMPHEEVALQ